MSNYRFCSEWAESFGLPTDQFHVAVEKYKTPFGRRVVVAVKRITTGEVEVDSVVGSQLTKRDLDRHAIRMASELAAKLGNAGRAE